MKYSTVTVTARRYDQPVYRYVAERKVRAGRAARVAQRVAQEVADHEGRNGFPVTVTSRRTGAVVQAGPLPDVGGRGCRFVVRAG